MLFRSLVRGFDKVTFTAVRRERNKAADALANQAMDEQEAAETGGRGARRERGPAPGAETGTRRLF